jgi:hypothetical protein
MNKNDILFIFHSPYSAWGLRYRVTKLPKDNDYTDFVELCAKAIEKKKLTSKQARFLVASARTGQKGIEVALDCFEKIVANCGKTGEEKRQ